MVGTPRCGVPARKAGGTSHARRGKTREPHFKLRRWYAAWTAQRAIPTAFVFHQISSASGRTESAGAMARRGSFHRRIADALVVIWYRGTGGTATADATAIAF
jgi:hypothetical protein